MTFKKMQKSKYPPRLWALVGYPGSGKSSFASQMCGPILVVDADHRFDEVLDLALGDVYEFSDSPADNVDPDRIAAILVQNMPGSGVQTIVVDSLTAIITPIVTQAMVDKDAGRTKNLVAGWRTKALAMRQLQDSVTRWGVDCLWIYHLNDARDAKGRALTKATVSQTELARLTRSINLQLEVVQDKNDQRGVHVKWARRGRSGMTLWDDTGTWAGMPEKIEAAVYDGLSKADQAEIEQQTPDHFPNPETAIAWGLGQGAFEALQHARNAYNKLKREHQPKIAQEMAALWVADVQGRLLTVTHIPESSTGDGGDDSVNEPKSPKTNAKANGNNAQQAIALLNQSGFDEPVEHYDEEQDEIPSDEADVREGSAHPKDPQSNGDGEANQPAELPRVGKLTPGIVAQARAILIPTSEGHKALGTLGGEEFDKVVTWIRGEVHKQPEIARAIAVLLAEGERVVLNKAAWAKVQLPDGIVPQQFEVEAHAWEAFALSWAITPGGEPVQWVSWAQHFRSAADVGDGDVEAAAFADGKLQIEALEAFAEEAGGEVSELDEQA